MIVKVFASIIIIVYALGVFIFVTVPSVIYGLSAWVLIPIGLLSRQFMVRPTRTKMGLVILKFPTVFLLIILPVILYLYVWEPLGWIFFGWMALYFLSRFYSGAHKRELLVRAGAKGLEDLEERYKRTYVKNNIIVSVIIIVLSAISLVVGYKIGGSVGLWIGVGFCILVLLISPLKESTVENIDKNDEEIEFRYKGK